MSLSGKTFTQNQSLSAAFARDEHWGIAKSFASIESMKNVDNVPEVQQ